MLILNLCIMVVLFLLQEQLIVLQLIATQVPPVTPPAAGGSKAPLSTTTTTSSSNSSISSSHAALLVLPLLQLLAFSTTPTAKAWALQLYQRLQPMLRLQRRLTPVVQQSTAVAGSRGGCSSSGLTAVDLSCQGEVAGVDGVVLLLDQLWGIQGMAVARQQTATSAAAAVAGAGRADDTARGVLDAVTWCSSVRLQLQQLQQAVSSSKSGAGGATAPFSVPLASARQLKQQHQQGGADGGVGALFGLTEDVVGGGGSVAALGEVCLVLSALLSHGEPQVGSGW